MDFTIDVDQFYDEVKNCVYKGEQYQVRNNGAIVRLTPKGKKARQKDGKWTFGETITNGYACFCGERVHRIVATAFLGEAPSNQHVVDHIDTNRQNNRPENLRWLTKLENILLNSITRMKIEYRCGSVESFLEDPSQLNGYEYEDKNFSWMRAVSPEEARKTLENWQKLMSRSRVARRNNSEPIRDWIFGQSMLPRILEESHSDTNILLPSITHEKLQEKVQTNRKQEPISKKMFLEELVNVCDKNGWTYIKYYKTEHWRSDVLIETEGARFSFSVYISKQQGDKITEMIMSEGVNAFGFVLRQSRKVKRDDFSRALEVVKVEDVMCVSVMGKPQSIGVFVEAIVSGHLVVEDSYLATAMNVAFIPHECHSCGRTHHIYMVHSLIDADSHVVCHCKDSNKQFDFSQFSPTVMNPVKRFVADNPQAQILMGEIKPRMSRMMGEAYMSFGCPHCDGVVGSWYLNEIEMDMIYSLGLRDCTAIQLQEPVEIKTKHWKVLP